MIADDVAELSAPAAAARPGPVRPLEPGVFEAAVTAACAFVALWIASRFQETPFDNYARFADALRQGRLWIDWPGSYIDAVLWNGHRYIVNDPLPGLLMLPFTVLHGGPVDQTAMTVVVGSAAVFAASLLGARLGVPAPRRRLLVAFVFLGTDLAWAATFGDVWFAAQVCAVAFTLFALVELAGACRPVPLALLWSAACLSRFTLVVATPVLVWAIVRHLDGSPRADARERLRRFATALAPVAAVYVAYNLARWGVPWDSGHTIFYHQDGSGSPTGSPFSLGHVPYELYSYLMQAPTFVGGATLLRPENAGIALTFTSPALVFAAWARRPAAVVRALWIAAALAIAPSLLYYANGYAQFGMRHALDFEPFLFALMLLAARERLPRGAVALCVFSIAVGAWGIWYWRAFVRGF